MVGLKSYKIILVEMAHMSQVKKGYISARSTVYRSKNWNRGEVIFAYMHDVRAKIEAGKLQCYIAS